MNKDMLRRAVAEFIGTFALVFMGTTTRVLVGGEATDFAGVLMVHLAFGLTILVMTYCLSQISAAHLNPAVTLGFAATRSFPWKYVLPYWIAQFAGAIAAIGVQTLLLAQQLSRPDQLTAFPHHGASTLQIGIWQGIGVEIVLTFFLMFISMATGTDRRMNKGAAGLVTGFTVALCGLTGNYLTGGSMNPARSLGPALFAGGDALTQYWIYLVGPIIGALLGAFVYQYVRGPKDTAKGAPDDLFPEAQAEDAKVKQAAPTQHIQHV